MAKSFKVRFELLPSDEGGLSPTTAIPSGSRSLLLDFGAPVSFGCVVWFDGLASASAGDRGEAQVGSWVMDEVRPFVVPGASFKIWYGREVGRGTVLSSPQ